MLHSARFLRNEGESDKNSFDTASIKKIPFRLKKFSPPPIYHLEPLRSEGPHSLPVSDSAQACEQLPPVRWHPIYRPSLRLRKHSLRKAGSLCSTLFNPAAIRFSSAFPSFCWLSPASSVSTSCSSAGPRLAPNSPTAAVSRCAKVSSAASRTEPPSIPISHASRRPQHPPFQPQPGNRTQSQPANRLASSTCRNASIAHRATLFHPLYNFFLFSEDYLRTAGAVFLSRIIFKTRSFRFTRLSMLKTFHFLRMKKLLTIYSARFTVRSAIHRCGLPCAIGRASQSLPHQFKHLLC